MFLMFVLPAYVPTWEMQNITKAFQCDVLHSSTMLLPSRNSVMNKSKIMTFFFIGTKTEKYEYTWCM